MAIVLSTGVIIGICASAGGLVLVAGTVLVIIHLRRKYKRLPALTSETTQRRSSRYSGSHFTLTDADFARTPGTRAKLRRPINNPYSSSRRDWATIPSCENPQRHAAQPCSSKALIVDGTRPDPNAGRRWPVPPRLKRTNAIPLSAIKASPSGQRVERSAKHVEMSLSKTQVPKPEQESIDKNTEHNIDRQMTANPTRPPVSVFPEAVTRPKPLFYGKQRSSSTGVIYQGSESNSRSASAVIPQAIQTQPESLPTRRLSLPRSSSLFAQPGQAPSIPMPKLPPETYTRIQKIKIPTEVSSKPPSGVSFISEYTSVLDEGVSRTFSHTDTDLTSTGLQSATASSFAVEGLSIDLENGKWENTSDLLGARGLRTQLGSQQSLGTSIQHSLPRDNSSGLRFSMYDHHQSRNESSTTLSKEISPTMNVRPPGSADRRSTGPQAQSSAPPLNGGAQPRNNENISTNRASKSIMKDVSGNEGSPLKWESRPSSIATSDQFLFDTHGSIQHGKSSALKGSAGEQKHQSCVRPSNLPTFIPLGPIFPTTVEKLEVTPACSPVLGLFSQASVSNRAMLQPNSRATFSRQTDLPRPRHDFIGKAEAVGSATQSVMGLYKQEDNGSSESIAYTPTRRPSGRNPSTVRPDSNRKSVFLSLNPYDPESAPNLPFLPNLAIAARYSRHAETSPPSSKHSSLQFPDPPKPFDPDSWRRTPLHGPRTPPHRFRSQVRRSPTRRYSPSRSPSRAGVGKSSSSPSPSPRNKELLSTIMDLRRMNSEVSESKGEKAHRRFRSLGSAEEVLGEGDGGSEEKGREEQREGLAEDVRTPRHVPELEIPGLLFSNQTKQEDIWDAPKWAVAGNGHGELYGEDGFLRD